MQSVSIIGCGYVGLLTGTVLAYKHKDKRFIFVDIDETKINNLKNGKHFIVEPSFINYFDMAKNIYLTTDYKDISTSDIVFITVCTPDVNGKCDLSYLYSTIDYINKYAKQNAIIVIKSTVEVGTTKELANNYFRKDLNIINIPEFLAEGEAVNNLLNPSHVVIGYVNKNEEISNVIKSLYYWIDYDKIIETDSNTSELSKLSSNFMLAQRITSINAIESLACEKDANILDISKIMRMDERIGCKYLSPSPGFGGSCFRKDINNISNICSDTEFSKYFMDINRLNDYHMLKIVDKIGSNKHILFLGYCFKEGSNDTRESQTQFIINHLPTSVTCDIYDINIEKYAKKPNGIYDYVILMLNENEYINIAKNVDKNKLINPRYIHL